MTIKHTFNYLIMISEFIKVVVLVFFIFALIVYFLCN